MSKETSLLVRLLGDASSLNSSLTESQKKLKAFGDKMKKVGKDLSLKLTLPIVAAGGAAIKFASDFDESMNKVDVAFGDSQKSVKEFAKTSLKQFGIAEGSALDMAAMFGDMSTSMGLSQETAAGLSTELVGLAGDLASFKNIDIEQATTALAGVFTGETESLKRLGIVMTEVNLKQFAMDNGLNSNIKNMTQAEKVALRYQFIMKSTANAQGDFARTGGGAANQMRIFQESLKELAVSFGQIILPAFTKIITKVNDLIQRFNDTNPTVKKLILVFGGIAAAIGPILMVLPSLVAGIGVVAGAIGTALGPITLFLGAVTALSIALPDLDEALGVQTSTWTKIKNLFLSGGNAADYAGRQLADGTPKTKKAGEEAETAADKIKTLSEELKKLLQPSEGVGRNVKTLETNLTTANLASQGFGEGLRALTEPTEIVGTVLKTKVIDPLKVMNSLLSQTDQVMRFIGEESAYILMDSFKALAEGQSFIKTLGNAIMGLIKQLLAAVAAAVVLSLVLGGLGIGKGFGGSFKEKFGSIFGMLSGFGSKDQQKSTGVAMAKGGIVSSPTLALVGEYGGAKTNPEVIAPLDKLKNMIGDRQASAVNVTGEFNLRGQDLVVALQRANRNRDRIL